ncbi:hypothetical protein B0T22DRAFT_438225 [Podospora appendiculata]|uniref:Uncharacterized protein n=1 Tax=Podospora appendiculata TaxID=314037 RepID=A0AAE1CI41_9PEZI|nr:hypothetical protein B0T22DRAFT_438225 [Podospora appendiculata]
MPKFPVAFGRRKSTAENLEHLPAAEPSFRVLERPDVSGGKSFDGGVRLSTKTHALPKTRGSNPSIEDNIFADIKSNRGSGSSNTTKTTSTDNSSRHSNASTAPSSTDLGAHEEWRNNVHKRLPNDIPVPPIPKSSSNGFLRAAGRTFSFGGQKKHLPPVPAADESQPPSPSVPEPRQTLTPSRSRATTSSTATTVTPPRVDGDFDLDLGGDFGRMMLGNDKRASVLTVKDDQEGRHTLTPRSLTGNRMNQPPPIEVNKGAKVEAPPRSWNSHRSHEQLLSSSSPSPPSPSNETPPPVPRHVAPLAGKPPGSSASPESNSRKPLLRHQASELEQVDLEDEEARLLKDSLSTVTRFMSSGSGSTASASASGAPSTSRYRRNEDSLNMSPRGNLKGDDESLFDTSHMYSPKSSNRFMSRMSGPVHGNKVMTPAEFESYRKDKERQDKERQLDTVNDGAKGEEDDEDHYEDDEDDLERAKQQEKQRRKQEAHMAVYRQQMMKVTGESANTPLSRPGLQISFSTPNLQVTDPGQNPVVYTEISDEDEEVPLAILAAHGFPNKNRAPARLSTMMSNPNLRAAQQPSYQRPTSVVGDASGAGHARLPAFARGLPQDPYLGANLVHNPVRENFALGGGAAASSHSGIPAHPGGLVGIIATEERSRAMRRGSPRIDGQTPMSGPPGFDPNAGLPSQMMYQNNQNPPMLTPGDQAQIQMTQQIQQFMQMQMQFMQMMSGQNGGAGPQGPNGHMATQSIGSMGSFGGMPAAGGMPNPMGVPGMGGPDAMRHSVVGNDSVLDFPSVRGDAQYRTMSMVQPSSASWIQPLPSLSFPSNLQGGGYAPSIAPSERSNIGLPGRYRPVSHAPPLQPVGPGHLRKSSAMSGAIQPNVHVTKSGNASDDDDEQGWEAMKAKREKKKSLWRTKKSIGGDISAFIT